MLKAASRGRVDPFLVMDVLRAAEERARVGGEVFHLELGQPGVGAPPKVIAAAHAALDGGKLGYTESLGLPELRQRIARHYGETYAVDLPAERIVITTGSSGAFILSFIAAFDVGDRVALAMPGYPAYRHILNALGVHVLPIPVTGETNFQPTPALLDEACRVLDGASLDGLIIASPSNPTGTMLSRGALADIGAWCAERGVRLVSDEIYHGITYEGPAETALALAPPVPGQAIVINSFSKYYAMAGWRLGWMVVPEDLTRSVECLAQNLFISPPTLPQIAAVAAFDSGADLAVNVRMYADNRARLLKELPQAGFGKLASSEGGFYLYADVGDLTNDSRALSAELLRETGVGTAPGRDFDPVAGDRFLRFSFAGSREDVAEACVRLKAWYGQRH